MLSSPFSVFTGLNFDKRKAVYIPTPTFNDHYTRLIIHIGVAARCLDRQ
ncbi:MAG: hypothetical protein IPJ13_02180 [Saprospiraceae bacterium]|nr:hypothetical protein [Saprospiraceae bacterium]